MPMSFDIARAFMFGVVPHGGAFPEPEPEPAVVGPTEEQLAKIREMFAPTETNDK